MEKIKIGEVVNVVGLKGEVKVYNYSDYKERFEELDYIYLKDVKTEIKQVRYMKDMVILKLSGVDDRNAAERLKGQDVCIDESQLRELPEDTYYIRDLIGMDVVDQDGKLIGTLTDVLKNTAQDVYQVKLVSGKTGLIPGVSQFIKNIDMEKRTIEVQIIEGLLD